MAVEFNEMSLPTDGSHNSKRTHSWLLDGSVKSYSQVQMGKKNNNNTLPARLQEICLGPCYDRIYTIMHFPGDRALAPCPVPAISTTSQVAFQTFWIKAAGPGQGFQPNRELSRKSLPTEQDGSLSQKVATAVPRRSYTNITSSLTAKVFHLQRCRGDLTGQRHHS